MPRCTHKYSLYKHMNVYEPQIEVSKCACVKTRNLREAMRICPSHAHMESVIYESV